MRTVKNTITKSRITPHIHVCYARFQQELTEGELTDHHIEILSERLSESDIRNIALEYKLSTGKVNNHIRNHAGQQAVRNILNQILHAHETRKEAYGTLVRVLKEVNLSLLATEVLNYPTENSN